MAANEGVTFHPIFQDAATNAIWAKHRIDNLDAFFANYIKTGVRVTVRLDNVNSPDFSQYFCAESQPIPFPIGIIVGEIIRSLRSSLDYAVCAMLVDQGAKERAIESAYFPISREDNKLADMVDGRTIKHGLSRLRSFFLDDVNATPTGNHPLWALNEIDRQNKHRSIPVTISTVFAPIPNWPGASGNLIALEPGAKIEIGLPPELYFEDNHQFNRTLRVSFGESKVFKGEPLVPVLTQLFHASMQALVKLQKAYIDAYH